MASHTDDSHPAPAGPAGPAAARARLLTAPGPGGRARRAELSARTDDWLAALFASAGAPAGAAVVAVGGYGRGELSPRSDLDVLLLHEGRLDPALPERLWYPVWDSGAALDHAVRTPAEARAVAAADLKAQLGLLDARHVAGDPALTAALRSTVLADWRAGAVRRLPELRELGRERAERHGELSFLLEPDLKEAKGGLRDVVALDAIAASWLADAPREGLDAAALRLADVRDALHLVTGRATERLALQDQDQVAERLGVLDADTLLRQVYEAARTVAYAADVTWRAVDRVLAARSGRGRRPHRRGSRSPVRSAARPVRPGAARARWPGARWSAGRSPRASSSRTARRCSPRARARPRTRCCRCAPRRRPRRTGSPSPMRRCAGWPPSAVRCRCPGRTRRASSWSPCSAPARPVCRSGRRWRRRG